MSPTAVDVFETLRLGPLQVNCYLAGNGRTGSAVCIDPGDEADRVVEAVERNGLSLDAILLTHAHFDHVGAAAAVAARTGAPVMAPRGEEELLAASGRMAAAWGFPPSPPPMVSKWLVAGDTTEGNGYRLAALDVRGHSPAGLAFLADGDVFVGDALFAGSIGRTDLPGGCHATLIDAIKRNLLTLPTSTRVHPGHGPSTTVQMEAEANPHLVDW